jgi:hypothetical protein
MTILRAIAVFLLAILSGGMTMAQTSIATPCFQNQGTCTTFNAPSVAGSAPVITLSGANPLSLVVGNSYVEPGYTATDNRDGNITSRVTVSGSVNTSVAGTYTLTYNVTNLSGQSAAPVMRTVNVTASSGTTTTYTLSSSQCNVVWVTNQYYNYGQHDADMINGGWGDIYYSLFKCSLTGMPTTATAVKLRLYEYPSSHGGGRSQIYFDRITSTWDNTTKWQTMPSSTNLSLLPAPVDNQWYEIDITALYNGWQGGTYPNYGVMLRPYSTSNIFNVFRSTEYSDANYHPQLVVTSTAAPNTPPVITLSGANPLSLNVGNTFVEPGYTATDTEDGNITSRVTVSGSVNTSVAGTYILTYNVTDLGGLSASAVTRTVIVSVPAPPPLSGSCAVNGSLYSITIQTGNTAYYGAGTSGGTSPFHFLWTGATGGDSSSASQVYNTAGIYTASVRITDSGSPQQQVTATCPQVNVTTQVVAPFASSCYITPSSIRLGSSATYVANASGGYPPYQFYLPGTLAYQSPFNQGMTIVPTSLGVQSYSGIVQDSHGQVLFPACSVTVTN